MSHASADSADRELLVEVGWEVCSQLGGIYTVLRSKAPAMVAEYGDRYYMVGPYHEQSAAMEFEELDPDQVVGPTLAALRSEGIGCRFGRWLVTGRPKVVLLNCRATAAELNALRHRWWQEHGIGLPGGDAEANDAIVFGRLVARFLEVLAERGGARRIVAHFHEWQGAMALPELRRRGLAVATVFTTHATLLGRYLCAANADFYGRLDALDPEAESGRLGIHHRWCMERAAAQAADVFTTVSNITASEAERLLGRQADLALPNGLNVEKFAALHEFQNLHARYKAKINDFVRGHFGPSYAFDLDKTLYFFLAGRYEYRNKGLDLFIESLSRLNHLLCSTDSEVTVVAFIITKAAFRSINGSVLEDHFRFEELRVACAEIQEAIGRALFERVAAGEVPTEALMLTEDAAARLKRLVLSRRRQTLPPVVTHDVADEAGDPILRQLRAGGLRNQREDRVKVVYHPDFITQTSPLFGIDYDQFVRGCHLGVFPSYYEPWGYTPAECTVLGVPSITSDLAGFGAFIQANLPDHDNQGLFVLQRRRVPRERTLEQLTHRLFHFTQLSRRQRIELRNRVERCSELLDWENLAANYFKAHRLARRRLAERLGGAVAAVEEG